jgi:hypothetical protein
LLVFESRIGCHDGTFRVVDLLLIIFLGQLQIHAVHKDACSRGIVRNSRVHVVTRFLACGGNRYGKGVYGVGTAGNWGGPGK